MHNLAVIALGNFLRNMRRKAVPIDQQINNLLQRQISKNREILKSLFKTVIFCEKNNIALRGRRDSIDATLEQIDKGAYVNIYTILQILITIPISSASCERSISTLRNLKTYLRNTMVQNGLNRLALMHAHREME